MPTHDDSFLQQLRATFVVEAREHLQVIAAGLLELEKTTGPQAQRQVLGNVFRAAHSLKGAARAVDMPAVESGCQALEDLLAAWRRGEGVVEPESLNYLHRKLDLVTEALADAEKPASRNLSSGRVDASPEATSFVAAPGTVASSDVPGRSTLDARGAGVETVRVSVAKLEQRLLQTQELLGTKLAANQHVADMRELAGHLEAWQRAWALVEFSAHGLRAPAHGSAGELARVLDFCQWSAEHLKAVAGRAAALRRVAERERNATCKLVDECLDESKRLLLLPFATVSAPLPKIVRDLCRDQGKEAELVVQGDGIEVDKRILEEMKDPLLHLLRNSIDHGIETPDRRRLQGKPARATITLAVTLVDAGRIQILLTDDGAGIDSAAVRVSAVSVGRITAEVAGRLDDDATNALIFASEVSTSPTVTRLSGRGLGLAIVRETTRKLGGEVTVESRRGHGTTFRMVVPATRSTFRGILLAAAGQQFMVPTVQVERVRCIPRDDVRTVEGRETVVLEGRAVALAHLADVLQLPPVESAATPSAALTVFITGVGDQRLAFAVDAILDEQEVLVKPLAKPLVRVRNVSAATVLGSGDVVAILDLADLARSARKLAGAPTRAAEAERPVVQKRVLVAEDSITSRMLIRSILEGAGYSVRTAADGLEAFSLLRSERFDLVVSDVEMPRLDGFGLTQRIRADRQLAELPVVLVTALESAQDRERGFDAGASAYLAKSSFDQSNLLEAVRRLL